MFARPQDRWQGEAPRDQPQRTAQPRTPDCRTLAGRLAGELQCSACAARWRRGWQLLPRLRRARRVLRRLQIGFDRLCLDAAVIAGVKIAQSEPRQNRAPLR